MRLTEWIKEELLREKNVGINRLKLNLLITPAYILFQVVLYYVYRDSLYEHGFLVIGGPMILALILTLAFLIPKRNNPEYYIYYIFHPTNLVKIGVFFSIIFCIILFFYAQCNAYSLPVNLQCFSQILKGK